MSKQNRILVEEALASLKAPDPEERLKDRKRGRPKGTTNKARMYDRAVVALMACSTVEAAAEMIGVTRQTLFHWLKDEEFLSKLDEARTLAFGQAMILLSAAAGTAVQTLVEIATDKHQPGSTRAAAANSLLTTIDKQMRDERVIREQHDRIQSLKRSLDEAVGLAGEQEQRALPVSTEG
jgi:DNA-binding XRE family transcriptional regulator